MKTHILIRFLLLACLCVCFSSCGITDQVKKARKDLNGYLSEIQKSLDVFLTELNVTVHKLEQKLTQEIVPRTATIMDDVDATLKIGILLLLLLGYFVTRHLRLSNPNSIPNPRNDFISSCEYLILSILEIVFLIATLAILLVTVYKIVTGKNIPDVVNALRAVSVALINAAQKRVTGIKNEKLLTLFILSIISLIIAFFCALPLQARKIVEVLSGILRPLRRNICVKLLVGFVCIFIVGLILLWYISIFGPLIPIVIAVLCVLNFSIGILGNNGDNHQLR